ncbi:hypothetical protein D5086_001591 [Populus alba]|uniref:Uncharacterized protein n=1 Tax=Populus alba TaxID=43335 RepID=A0ACC4CZ80_POPAL
MACDSNSIYQSIGVFCTPPYQGLTSRDGVPKESIVESSRHVLSSSSEDGGIMCMSNPVNDAVEEVSSTNLGDEKVQEEVLL